MDRVFRSNFSASTGATWAEIGAAITLAAALGGIEPEPALAIAAELEERDGG